MATSRPAFGHNGDRTYSCLVFPALTDVKLQRGLVDARVLHKLVTSSVKRHRWSRGAVALSRTTLADATAAPAEIVDLRLEELTLDGLITQTTGTLRTTSGPRDAFAVKDSDGALIQLASMAEMGAAELEDHGVSLPEPARLACVELTVLSTAAALHNPVPFEYENFADLWRRNHSEFELAPYRADVLTVLDSSPAFTQLAIKSLTGHVLYESTPPPGRGLGR